MLSNSELHQNGTVTVDHGKEHFPNNHDDCVLEDLNLQTMKSS